MEEINEDSKTKLLLSSRDHLSEAIKIHPLYYDARLASGACQYYLENYTDAAADYMVAVRQFPDDQKANLGLHYSLTALGTQQWELGDSTQAIRSLEEAWNVVRAPSVAEQISVYYSIMDSLELASQWKNRAINE